MKKLIALVLCTALLLCCLPAAKAVGGFTDVKDSAWFAEAVDYCAGNNLMTGTSATTFSPNGTMTRAMLVTVLHRMAGTPAPASFEMPFVDVKASSYYAKAVLWAGETGITSGMTETTFAPNGIVTREQAATFFYRYAKWYQDHAPLAQGGSIDLVSIGEVDMEQFTDWSKVKKYAQESFMWAFSRNIITGTTPTILDPAGSLTRAQAATILMRLHKAICAQANGDLEPVTLRMMFHGSNVTPQASEKVMAELNAYLQEKINVTLEPIWETWSSFETSASNCLVSGENVDIYFTSSWTGNEYTRYASLGYYVKLDDMLDTYAPELKTVIPQGLWDCAMTDGADGMGVYAVPGLKDTAVQNCWDVNGTLLASLGYDVDEVCASGLDFFSPEFEQMLAKAKKAKGADFYPLAFDPVLMERMVLNSAKTDAADALSFYYDKDHPSADIGSEIVNKFATDQFARYAARVYELAQKGYISPSNQDRDTADTYVRAAHLSGEYLLSTESYIYGCEEVYSMERGIDVRMIPTGTPYMDYNAGQGSMMAISTASKNPERALMFLNLLNTDPVVMTYLNYGLEGYTYEKNADGTISFLEGRVDYTPWTNGMGNVRILPALDYQGPDYWGKFSAFYNTAEALPYAGFVFDYIGSDSFWGVFNVVSESTFHVLSGAADPAQALPQLLTKLDAAGMDELVRDARAQLADYMAKLNAARS